MIPISSQSARALSSLVSIVVSKFLLLDTTVALTLSNLFNELLIDNGVAQIFNSLTKEHLLIVVGVVGIYFAQKWCKKFARFFGTKQGDSIKISLFPAELMDVVRFFMQHNPRFFYQRYNVDYGNPTLTYSHNYDDDDYVLIIPENYSIISFNDTIHNVKGRIISKTIQQKRDVNGKDITVHIPYLEIWIDNGTVTGTEYIDLLIKWKADKIARDTRRVYYHVKIMNHNKEIYKHHTVLYDGSETSKEERYKKYMEPYFSPHKKRLWNQISTIQWNPEKIQLMGQNPGINLLLYGPPGSGKSTLAYRMAMALGRHLISFDLTATNSRKAIYNVFQSPSINSNYGGSETLAPNQFILLLEEFDIVIDHLLKKKEMEQVPRITFNLDDLSENKKSDTNDKTKIISREREFALEDLLELFQGAVPLPGSIIIATTNHYEKIRSILPALFRAGRLTPEHFDNLNWDTLQELSRYYFKREVDIPRVDRVPCETSKIVELAVKSCLDEEDGFEYFQSKLRLLMEEQ